MKKLHFYKNIIISALVAMFYLYICTNGEASLDVGIAAGTIGTFLCVLWLMFEVDFYARKKVQKHEHS